MKNFFEQFVKDEMEYICDDYMFDILLENFEGELSEDELDDNLEYFINQAIKNFCNNEYIIQSLHDWMHDEVNDVVKQYVLNKEE